MNISVLTIFPEMLELFWQNGMIKRAIERKLINCSGINIRDFAEDKHKSTDDKPYGGGSGMVMKPEPLSNAVRSMKTEGASSKVILLTPQGRVFNQKVAKELSQCEDLIFVCGRYEGVDERIFYKFIDEEISLGDYVLTGGELASMVIIDAVVRFIPGVLGSAESAEKDSFSDGLIEHAHYTRPYDFEGLKVPDVLLSGNHKEIEMWRLEDSLKRTFLKRPDLMENRKFSSKEKEILKKWCLNIESIIQS